MYQKQINNKKGEKKMKKMNKHMIQIFLLVAISFPTQVMATLIGSGRFIDLYEGIDTAQSGDIDFQLYLSPFLLFDALTISSTDVGTEFISTSVSDPAFTGFVSKLTNGIDDFITNDGFFGTNNSESLAFGTSPDFAGNIITRLGLEIVEVKFTLTDDFGRSFWKVDTLLNVYSEPSPVPEPATMLLMGTGLVGLAGGRIRRKKQA